MLVLLVLTASLAGGVLRARRSLAHPALDRGEAASVVRSDPALLLYLSERVHGARGLPLDAHACTAIEHPTALDLPEVFTLGIEFVALALDPLLERLVLRPGDGPHVRLLWVTSLLAALAGLGVALLAREVCGSWGWGLVAALLHGTLPAAYRTLGFVAMREDLALPLLALHLGLLARATRTGGRTTWVASGATAGLALGTWHGSGILLLLTAASLLGVLLRSGGSAGRLPRRALGGALALLAVSLVVPALRAKGGPLAAPVAALLGLALAGILPLGRTWRTLLAFAIPLALVAVGRLVADGGGDLGHVLELLLAKLEHLGERPASPAGLSFEARMMWQGPFSTLDGAGLLRGLQALLLVLPLALLWSVRPTSAGGGSDAKLSGTGARVLGAVALLFLLGLAGAWLAERVLVLPALLAPVLAAEGLRRLARTTPAPLDRLGPAAFLVLHGLLFTVWLGNAHTPWHDPQRARAAVAAMRAVERCVPPGEAVAADFVTGPTVLACTGRPVPLSPKWERSASRARVQRFWTLFHFGGPEAFRRHLLDDLDCRYLLVDRRTLFTAAESRWLAGYAPDELVPRPGTAAAALLPSVVEPAPEGYELLWSGEPRPAPQGTVPGWYQLYRVLE